MTTVVCHGEATGDDQESRQRHHGGASATGST